MDKFATRFKLLRERGYELRRPVVEYIGDDIYELRVEVGNVQYRILYFFHERSIVVLAHGLKKKKAIPPVDVQRVIKRKERFRNDPDGHTAREKI
jgi:phage-related protein